MWFVSVDIIIMRICLLQVSERYSRYKKPTNSFSREEIPPNSFTKVAATLPKGNNVLLHVKCYVHSRFTSVNVNRYKREKCIFRGIVAEEKNNT
jgi:hypothetical protein